jgi:hypothetical protein
MHSKEAQVGTSENFAKTARLSEHKYFAVTFNVIQFVVGELGRAQKNAVAST